jgi:adenine deaminase
VVNRYKDAPPAVGFIKGFNLKEGAIASSVAHDSHNIVALGKDDQAICRAVNLIIEHKGGISVVGDTIEEVLPLPVAGLMSDKDALSVAERYVSLSQGSRQLGSTLRAPFMTLSFMCLLVIPKLKMSDRGLFDSRAFRFVSLFDKD